MNGDVPSVVEQTNSAVSVSLILSVLGVIVATGGTVKEKRERRIFNSPHMVTTHSNQIAWFLVKNVTSKALYQLNYNRSKTNSDMLSKTQLDIIASKKNRAYSIKHFLTENNEASHCLDAVIVRASEIRHSAYVQASISQRHIGDLQLQKIRCDLSRDERAPILTTHDQFIVPEILKHSPTGCYICLANETCHHANYDCVIGRRLEETHC